MLIVSPQRIAELMDVLVDLAASWELFIGQLGVSKFVIDQIKLDHTQKSDFAKHCLQSSLHYLVTSGNPPTYSKISAVLRGKVVTHENLALKVERLAGYGMIPRSEDSTLCESEGRRELVSGIDNGQSLSTTDYKQSNLQQQPSGTRESPSAQTSPISSQQFMRREPYCTASNTTTVDESTGLLDSDAGTSNRQKCATQSCAGFFTLILMCAMIFFLAGSAIIFAYFETRYNTTPSTQQSRTTIQQGDIIILSTGENYCVSSESVTSLNVTEVLPLHSINIVALYKHQGDWSSLPNISSIPVMVSIPKLELTTGELLRTIYAASYASVWFNIQILNIVPLNGFTSDNGSLTLYILGSDEDAECFDEQGKNCHYIQQRSLKTDSGSLSVASFQTFKPGYYLLYLLPKNVDITVAFNYTLQFDTFNADDFTQPVCTIRAGNECENITLRQNEGTVCLIASVVSSGSDQFFKLNTRVFSRPLHLHDPTTKTLLAFGAIFFLIFLISVMVLVVAVYKCQNVRT